MLFNIFHKSMGKMGMVFLIPCEYWHLFPQGKVFYHLNSVYLGLTSEGQKVTGQVSQEPLCVARALWGVPSYYLPELGV